MARPAGAMLRIAAKSVSDDPNNLPAVLSPAGVSCKLASLKQARALFRLAFRSSAQTEGFCETGSDSESDRSDVDATVFIAACARSAWARDQNIYRNGVQPGFWCRITISLRSEAKHSQGEPKARGICAPTPKTPDPEFGFD